MTRSLALDEELSALTARAASEFATAATNYVDAGGSADDADRIVAEVVRDLIPQCAGLPRWLASMTADIESELKQMLQSPFREARDR